MTTEIFKTKCKFCGTNLSYTPIAGLHFSLKPTVCERCDDLRRTRYSAEMANELYAGWVRKAGVYASTDLNHPQMPSAAKQEKILTWKYGPIGLTIHGPTRKGKTRLMWQLVKRLILEDGHIVEAYNDVELASLVAQASMSCDPLIETLCMADVLFLDDLGKCKMTERVESALYGIVEQRVKNQLPILITTNFSGDSLISKFSQDRGPAIIQRIREFTTQVSL